MRFIGPSNVLGRSAATRSVVSSNGKKINLFNGADEVTITEEKEVDGQTLLADVSRVFDAHAESVDLTRLDQEWLSRDREIVSACGPQILNRSEDTLLFVASKSRQARFLRPSLLHTHLPQSRFENASRVIAANAGL